MSIKGGTIAREEFENFLQAFYRKAKLLNDDWQLVEYEQGQQKMHYLEKRKLCRCLSSVDKHSDSEASLEDNIEEEDDCPVVEMKIAIESKTVCQFVFHIVYSASYSVPVLYFTASKSDGSLLSLADIWANVPEVYQHRLEAEKWTFLTQQEHPILGRPFYQLHPCHTADLMKDVLMNSGNQTDNTINYIVSWLSFVGPVVGLELSPRNLANRLFAMQCGMEKESNVTFALLNSDLLDRIARDK